MSRRNRRPFRPSVPVFSFQGARYLLDHPKKADLASIGERKTAVFLHIRDTDRSMDRLASLIYNQALQILHNSADERKGNHLKVPAQERKAPKQPEAEPA